MTGKQQRAGGIVAILRRRRWLVLLPLAAGLALPAIRGFVVEIFALAPSAAVPSEGAERLQAGALAAGAVGGLLIGLGLVAVLEYRNSRGVTEQEVVHQLSLPVLGAIPVMTSARERQHESRVRATMDIIGCLALVAAALLITSRLLL